MKLLIDECLSEEPAKLARNREHLESSHVRWIGKVGAKDLELLPSSSTVTGPS
jgi:predicted nuclease of predicted toxin-antitoxin system